MSSSAVIDVGHVYPLALVDIFATASQDTSAPLQKDLCIEVVQVVSGKLSNAQRLFASSSTLQQDSKQAQQQNEEIITLLRVVSSLLGCVRVSRAF